jgi:hypothetical protein
METTQPTNTTSIMINGRRCILRTCNCCGNEYYARDRYFIFVNGKYKYPTRRYGMIKRCKSCGDSTGGNLNAHHIKRFIDISNGITLCDVCHRKVHSNETK